MKQTINFHQALPKLFAVRFPFQWILVIILSFISLLIFFSIYQINQGQSLLQQLNTLEARKLELTQKIGKTYQEYVENPENKSIEKEVMQLQHTFEIKTQILNALQDVSARGFSKYLDAFAQHILPDVWLINLAITEGGRLITLIGKSYAMEKVTQFMKNLQQDPLFQGWDIKLEKIGQAESEADTNQAPRTLFDFTLKLRLPKKVT